MTDFDLAEDHLPVYDVSDAVATVVDADQETAWGSGAHILVGALLDSARRAAEGDLQG